MVPHLPVGSVVLTQREPLAELQVGDVVVFHRPDQPGMLVVHRVIALRGTTQGSEVRTKGDANSVADPWNPFVLHGPDVYVARHDVPYLGFLVTDARSDRVRLVMFVGAALLAVAAVRYLLRRAPEEDRPTSAIGNDPTD
jgi:signal peptidase